MDTYHNSNVEGGKQTQNNIQVNFFNRDQSANRENQSGVLEINLFDIRLKSRYTSTSYGQQRNYFDPCKIKT